MAMTTEELVHLSQELHIDGRRLTLRIPAP